MTSVPPLNRRELATRQRAWPKVIAGGLARAGVTPNQISVTSILFALVSGAAFWMVGARPGGDAVAWLVLAAIGIQLRLLCNMLDGLLAIEGGLKSKTGDLYNEAPDRIADIAILVGAGYALHGVTWGATLGWVAALLAVVTAYVRLLGGSLGFAQDFGGPMAKQHRMFMLTVGALAAAIEVSVRGTIWSVAIALALIVGGSVITAARRMVRIARLLEGR